MSASEPLLLALETSCDETAAAVLRGKTLLSSEVASQIELHRITGGVVPEVASRNHLRMLRPVITAALEKAGCRLADVAAFAATLGPGLATSLMVGASVAKGLAVAADRPFIGVNHIEGHLLSPFFDDPEGVHPAIGLVVSGGHTLLVKISGVGQYELLGQTRDDAAGEAFDKVGKLMGLPYPGGPEIDKASRTGDRKRFEFPRSMLDSGDLNFSFSGLKTSARYLLEKLGDDRPLPDLCASFQEAITDVLVKKTLSAASAAGLRTIAISGGVSCNSRVRERFQEVCNARRIKLAMAQPWLCTDNAAMIGHVAALRLALGETSPLAIDINPNLRLAA